MTHAWHIITGEFPPQPGGVSDYTCLLAGALMAAGDEVDVWAPQCSQPNPAPTDVPVHRLDGGFGPRGLAELDHQLRRRSRASRLLVQYVPHMYGFKAMNLPFCAWLAARCRPAPWLMFHEVAFPVQRGQGLRHNLLGRVHHLMARLAARSAERVFVAIPRWETQLNAWAGWRGAVTWLPVPSNLPTRVSRQAADQTRRALLAERTDRLLGHFGTFSGAMARMLEAILPDLLRDGRMALMLGRGSTGFVAELSARHPQLADRCFARADLPAHDVACHLAACDVLVQPYVDGVSSRRGSAMAGLALGKPMATTRGPATEPVWSEHRLVALADAPDRGLAESIERLLADPDECAALGERAAAGYEQFFSLRNTVNILRS